MAYYETTTKGITMNKEKLAKLKKQIKHRVPEIIVGATVIAGAAAAYYIYKNQDAGEKLVALTNDEWTKLMSGDAIKIDTDAGVLYIAKEFHM